MSSSRGLFLTLGDAVNRLLILGVGFAVLACVQPAGARCEPRNAQPLHRLATDAPLGPVQVRGVVTAVFPGLHGFFLEASAARWDKNPKTPEAIFVYTARHASLPARGEILAMTGKLQDFHGVRELARTRVLADCGSAPLPPAVTVTLPLPAHTAWSALLGMRIRFLQPLVVSDVSDLGRYGEMRLGADSRILAPTALRTPGRAAIALARSDRERSVWMDDGNAHIHPWPIVLAGMRFDTANPIRAGQIVQGLEGIAFRAFGRDIIEPLVFRLDRAANLRPPARGPTVPPGLRIVTFNVDNYFNRAFAGPAFPTERGARTPQELQCQTSKLIAVLSALRPAVAGLEEIENNGYGADAAVAHLVGAFNEALGEPRYAYVRPFGARLGNGLIAPAIVYDRHRLVLVGRVAVFKAPAERALAEGLPRPALAASFRERQIGFVFTVAVVHLRAKLDSCGATLNGYGGSGYCAGARDAAATALAKWLADDPTGVHAGTKLLLGDFNAYPRERAIRLLESAGWEDVVAGFIPSVEKRYTTNYHAGAGALDYVFANKFARERMVDAVVWHVDADEPSVFGYEGRPSCKGSLAPYRASDHDPVLVVLADLTPTTGG